MTKNANDKIQFKVLLYPENGRWTAMALSPFIAGQGDSEEAAFASLKKTILGQMIIGKLFKWEPFAHFNGAPNCYIGAFKGATERPDLRGEVTYGKDNSVSAEFVEVRSASQTVSLV